MNSTVALFPRVTITSCNVSDRVAQPAGVTSNKLYIPGRIFDSVVGSFPR